MIRQMLNWNTDVVLAYNVLQIGEGCQAGFCTD
jgi:hypothetical protein